MYLPANFLLKYVKHACDYSYSIYVHTGQCYQFLVVCYYFLDTKVMRCKSFGGAEHALARRS